MNMKGGPRKSQFMLIGRLKLPKDTGDNPLGNVKEE